ncbi:TIGR04211 family SH3 domain-containing protein [Pelobacter seleniigenes]|uniref:TIGR04211 family SH3 domain-containing protein n=1 Tax=Pelobacter seleniigenes TaxID=407188 RepID=UPI0004A77296|nr:TIGR04211 family SH3 domain-containing protein [Pelobacter seleniigenes]
MTLSLRSAFISLSLLLIATAGFAETRYISDVLVVTVRSNTGNNYQTVDNLKTATPVEVLSEDQTYVKVRTPEGKEGYILRQYVTKELPKAVQIDRLEKETAALKEQLQQQQQSSADKLANADANLAKIAELQKQLQVANDNLDKVKNEYDSLLQNSQNVVSLSTENEDLIEQNKQLNNELVVLREENRNFHRSNMIQWFLAGGGVFFGGWIIGKISRKKQRGFSRL